MSEAAHPGHGSKSYRAYVLTILLIVYTFNFIDRVLLGVVQEAIKHDLHIDDFQLGLLGGPAFAILYTLFGVPIARTAERRNRIGIIALGAAVWSLMTAACGFAQNFVQLAAARVGVGIGEAACVPSSHSVISDYFPASRRASALAIFGLGVPFGTMFAAVGGGWLVANVDWRSAFWLLGLPGILVALVLKLTVREPPRAGPPAEPPRFGEALALLARKPTFWHVSFAGAAMAFVGYSTAQFLVSYFVRTYGMGLAEASYAFGAIAGFAVGVGVFLGGFLCDRISVRDPTVYAWLPAIGVLISVPMYLYAFTQSSFWIAFAVLMIAPIFQYTYLGPGVAVMQSIAPVRMRATASALLLLITNLIGLGLGPPVLGALSDYFANRELAALGLSAAQCGAADAPAGCGPAFATGLKNAVLCVILVLILPGVQLLVARSTLKRDLVS